jgi:hypothetical protein
MDKEEKFNRAEVGSNPRCGKFERAIWANVFMMTDTDGWKNAYSAASFSLFIRMSEWRLRESASELKMFPASILYGGPLARIRLGISILTLYRLTLCSKSSVCLDKHYRRRKIINLILMLASERAFPTNDYFGVCVLQLGKRRKPSGLTRYTLHVHNYGVKEILYTEISKFNCDFKI